MYLRSKSNGDLVEILDLESLFNPLRAAVPGRFHSGEEMQDPQDLTKAELEFPSGEGLPRCWIDPGYRG